MEFETEGGIEDSAPEIDLSIWNKTFTPRKKFRIFCGSDHEVNRVEDFHYNHTKFSQNNPKACTSLPSDRPPPHCCFINIKFFLFFFFMLDLPPRDHLNH
ncbi:unnamed protein product [Camellia sinensis]